MCTPPIFNTCLLWPIGRMDQDATDTEVGLSLGDIVLDGDPALHPKKGTQPPIFGPCLLWPNKWMHRDTTWYGGRPLRHCVRWGPISPSRKGAQLPPIFGPCPPWPNGWMDSNAAWYGVRPRPRLLCVRWGPSSPPPKREHSPPTQFSVHVYCGQAAGLVRT